MNAFKESLGIPTVLMVLAFPMTVSTRPTRNFTCPTSTVELRLQSGI